MTWFTKNRLWQWVLAGLAMGLGLMTAFWWVSIIGVGYFLHLIYTSGSTAESITGTLLAWFIKAGLANTIFWLAYPINWLPIEIGQWQLLFIFLYWFFTSLAMTVGVLLVVYTEKILKNVFSNRHPVYLLGIASVWVIAEIICSFAFSILMYGPGGTFNISYSVGYIGYAIADSHWLLQFAHVGGVYALGFLIVVLGFVFLHLWQQGRYGVAFLIALTLLGTSGVYKPLILEAGADMYRIAVIDTHYEKHPSTAETAHRFELITAVDQAMEFNPDYIILPEAAAYLNHQLPKQALKYGFLDRYPETSTILVDSGSVPTHNNSKVLQATLVDTSTGDLVTKQKQFLVPQGEYLPYFFAFVIGAVTSFDMVDYLAQYMSYTVGEDTEQSVASQYPEVLFCFENLNPSGVRNLLRENNKMPFIANPVSHSWFRRSPILEAQMHNWLQAQAVWNDVFIVTAHHRGDSVVVAPTGEVIALPIVAAEEEWVVREAFIPK